MAAPSITIALTNPGGAGRPASIDQIPIYCGTCESGTVATVYTFGSLADAKATLTRGHLVDVIAYAFSRGATSVKCARMTGTVAAAASSVTATALGGTITIGGTLSQSLDCKIEIVAGGDNGVGTFRYTLDDYEIPGVDPTWSQTLTIPVGGVYTFPGTAMTATFDDATPFATAGTAEWTVTPAYYSATEVALMTDAVQLPGAGDATFLVYCGESATASGGDTLAAGVASQIGTLFATAEFFGALYGAGAGTDAEVIAAVDGTVSSPPFVAGMYGAGFVTNPEGVPGRGRFRLLAHEIAAVRIASCLISEDPGRTASGALAGVVATSYDARAEGDALYDARIGCLTTYQSRLSGGVFIQRVRLLDSAVGDFVSWPDAAVMIAACRAVHPVAWIHLLESFRQNADLTMDARDRADLSSAATRALSRALLEPLNRRGYPGHVTAATATVVPTTVLPAIDVQIAIRRLGYGEDLTFTLRYAGEV